LVCKSKSPEGPDQDRRRKRLSTEVEKVIWEHKNIKEVCVIGMADPDWGEVIKAVCVLHSGRSMTAQEIIDFVASKIARYKNPNM
jgi:acyl-CoA synthetase (AMP-forming)/AMP-acid ligase II